MIGYLVINVFQVGLILRLDKHLVVKRNWLIWLNDDIVHLRLNTKFNSRTLYLFNYNMHKHSNINDILCREYYKR